MKKNVLLTLCLSYGLLSIAQSVTTFAGKENSSGFENYESASSKDLDDTYFSFPTGICFDPAGKMYISERNKVRIIANGQLHIRVGSLQQPTLSEGYRNATGTTSNFRNPHGMVCTANGDLYVCDTENHAIRKVAKYVNLGNGQVASTFAGAAPSASQNGTVGSSNGTATASRFNQPTDITVDASGSFYVTDRENYTIRKISSAGVVSTLAGTAGTRGTSDGSGASANFGSPYGVAIYNNNTIVVTDPWNGNVRKINMFSGVTTTLAGSDTGNTLQIVDGTLTEARFKSPKGIAVIAGIIYVADQNVIRAIDEINNTVTTFVGNVANFSIVDGVGSSAFFTEIAGLTSDGQGNLYVTENSSIVNSHVIRKITVNQLTPVARFQASNQDVRIKETVVLEDISSGQTPTSRTWTISPKTYTITKGDLSTDSIELDFTLAGFYNVALSITNDYGTSAKSSDNYIAVSTTGAVTNYVSSDMLKVYPNPASESIYVKIDPSLGATVIHLYHINGNLIKALQSNEIVSTADLASGTYFITVSSPELNIAKKLVITHR
jgi:sugar lactone lactonase YvrE